MKIIKSLFLIACITPLSLSAFYFYEDFESWTPGTRTTNKSYPTGVTVGYTGITGSHTGIIYAVDESTPWTDPFGPDNQSLMIHRADSNPSGAGSIPRVTFRIPELSTGEISFRLYVRDNTPASSASTINLFLAKDSTAAEDQAINIGISNNRLSLSDDGIATGSRPRVENAIPFDMAVDVRVVFFDDYTYSFYLNDEIVTAADKTLFKFENELGINYIQFASAWNTNTNTMFFIDDLTIIPEGASVATFAGVMLLLLVGFRLRKRLRGTEL